MRSTPIFDDIYSNKMEGNVYSAPLAFFLPALHGGGAERIILNLATAGADRGYKIEIILAKTVGEYLEQIPPGVRIIGLKASRPLTAVPALARYLSQRRPRCLLATITNANLAALWALRLSGTKTRCIVREASTLNIELAQASVHNRFLMPRLIKNTYPQAHTIIAPSFGVADNLAQTTGIPRNSIEVIYNPIITNELIERSQYPTDHPWFKDSYPVIVGMGRLTHQKDFDTLIKAFAQVRKITPARMIILGEGEDRSALEELCRTLNINEDVCLPGFVANPYPFLSRAALFVLSSRWEGLPGVLVEALACGTKVVSTDCPSGPREILDNGIYGQLTPIEDESAMASAILKALTGKFVAKDPTQQIQLFKAEKNINRYLRLMTS